jgi:uncharacterized membrane protein
MPWFYIQNGQRTGPVEESELFRMARDGQLSPGDLVWNPGMGQEWKPASEVSGLFASPPAPAPAIPGSTHNRDLMGKALASLRGRWAVAVGATLLYQLVINGGQVVLPRHGHLFVQMSASLAYVVFILLICGPLLVGWNRFFLKMARRESPDLGRLFDGFKMFGKAAGTYLLMSLYLCLWSLWVAIPGFVAALTVPLIHRTPALGVVIVPLLVALGLFSMVPVIRATLAYSQIFFILSDHPGIRAMEAINRSKQMMDGFKWKKFCLGWRFLGWALLSILTCGIGGLWLFPYIMTANAHFYEDIRT